MIRALFFCFSVSVSFNVWAQSTNEDALTLYLFATNRVAAYPVSGPSKLISKFGDPRGGGRRHKGVDLGARAGTPVVAAWDGKVTESTFHSRAGYYVKIIHPNGYLTFYAHLQPAISVTKGQVVKAGQLLGGVGMSGNAKGTTPHLHFEIHNTGGQAVDPWPFLN